MQTIFRETLKECVWREANRAFIIRRWKSSNFLSNCFLVLFLCIPILYCEYARWMELHCASESGQRHEKCQFMLNILCIGIHYSVTPFSSFSSQAMCNGYDVRRDGVLRACRARIRVKIKGRKNIEKLILALSKQCRAWKCVRTTRTTSFLFSQFIHRTYFNFAFIGKVFFIFRQRQFAWKLQ